MLISLHLACAVVSVLIIAGFVGDHIVKYKKQRGHFEYEGRRWRILRDNEVFNDGDMYRSHSTKDWRRIFGHRNTPVGNFKKTPMFSDYEFATRVNTKKSTSEKKDQS